MWSVKLSQYPPLTTGLSRLRVFVHRPLIGLSAYARSAKVLALCHPISNDLCRPEREGVIERVDASLWIPITEVARGNDNSVRLCVNLSKVNQAGISERYPLPTMEEVTERVAGSTVFSQVDLSCWYLQWESADECCYLTVFVTHVGVIQW